MRNSGFTLPELMISILLILIVTAAVMALFTVFLNHYTQAEELTKARQRGEMVISILKTPVLNCGLGIPNETTPFQDSFRKGQNYELEDISDWDGPVSCDPYVAGSSQDLQLVYAVPTEFAVTDEVEFSNGTTISLTVNEDISGSASLWEDSPSPSGTSTKNWILFPTAGVPFLLVTNPSGGPSTIQCFEDGNGAISKFDTLHYLKAMEAYCQDDVFYTRDVGVTGSSAQPRVQGIEKVYYEFDGDSNRLDVYVLARGDNSDTKLDPNREVDGWPLTGDYPAGSRNYYLTVVRGSWRVRN
jgi:prepilin-type N-terminal cleavage/methylation domain-containing protein